MRTETKAASQDPALAKLSPNLLAQYAELGGAKAVVYLQPNWEVEQVGGTHQMDPGTIELGDMRFRAVPDQIIVQRNNLLASRLVTEITQTTGSRPHYLDALGAYVFSATLEQAKVIAAIPEVISMDLSGSQIL